MRVILLNENDCHQLIDYTSITIIVKLFNFSTTGVVSWSVATRDHIQRPINSEITVIVEKRMNISHGQLSDQNELANTCE